MRECVQQAAESSWLLAMHRWLMECWKGRMSARIIRDALAVGGSQWDEAVCCHCPLSTRVYISQ